LPDFDERKGLTGQQLSTLMRWTEEDFLQRTEGSPIRRIGHARWLRNVSVAVGNALAVQPAPDQAKAMRNALELWLQHPTDWVREHVQWALAQDAV